MDIANTQLMADQGYELWRVIEVKAEREGGYDPYAREMRQRWELAQAKVARAINMTKAS